MWLDDLAEEMGVEDRHHVYRVLRSYFHLVRDGITVEQAAQFSAQLPHFLRGVFYEGWSPATVPQREAGSRMFLASLADSARLAGEIEASLAAVATTRVLRRHISPNELHAVERLLPGSIQVVLYSTDR
jgi:uncharacterized protein (DUF2267 family)